MWKNEGQSERSPTTSHFKRGQFGFSLSLIHCCRLIICSHFSPPLSFLQNGSRECTMIIPLGSFILHPASGHTSKISPGKNDNLPPMTATSAAQGPGSIGLSLAWQSRPPLYGLICGFCPLTRAFAPAENLSTFAIRLPSDSTLCWKPGIQMGFFPSHVSAAMRGATG